MEDREESEVHNIPPTDIKEACSVPSSQHQQMVQKLFSCFHQCKGNMLPISLDVCNTTHHHFSTHQHHHCSPPSTIIALLTITIVPTITITVPPTSLTIAEVHYLVSSSTNTSQGKGIQTCLFLHQSCWLQYSSYEAY